MIDKLQKSKNNFKIWYDQKEHFLKERRELKKLLLDKAKKEELDKIDKKKTSEVAFKEWLRVKEETDKEKKEEALKTERKTQKLKRKENDGKKDAAKKPPVPYDAWLVDTI